MSLAKITDRNLLSCHIAQSYRNRSILLEDKKKEEFFILFTANGSFISRFIETRNTAIYRRETMNPAMNMMPMMNNMMPAMMNPMMGGMMPMMSGMPMMPMMNGAMMPMMMMMGSMKCTMTAEGMVCEMKPMEGMDKDMFMECCKGMMSMMSGGMPMMMNCGGMRRHILQCPLSLPGRTPNRAPTS
ncbi:hypothetical protein [Rhizobium lentis]|uniref:hypothetical protein n=1 Tax=Rhizobium lentis TaxID=1138194 RepID=UPI001A92C5AB|nr:hypothetical protein [Rhizobium lentis]MBX5015339.1 hypothetical protein [Rhizobium lentis]MBX5066940.1 hypothetical protein [Rhizobium lentis]MBX5078399.1 hypothetical protein [Rhizobium lentis]MBX5147932.1 hypothetical protein [Rhizobium lentis]QSW97238.1 hypothetical protein J0663_29755 [Rhizobium lentis]